MCERERETLARMNDNEGDDDSGGTALKWEETRHMFLKQQQEEKEL